MTLTRRSFFGKAATGAAVIAAVPILGSSLVAPVACVGKGWPVRVPVGLMSNATIITILAATRDVYSAEIYRAALPIMKLDQFRNPKQGVVIPRFKQIDPEVLEIERQIRARVAARMLPGRSRRFFDFSWLRGKAA